VHGALSGQHVLAGFRAAVMDDVDVTGETWEPVEVELRTGGE